MQELQGSPSDNMLRIEGFFQTTRLGTNKIRSYTWEPFQWEENQMNYTKYSANILLQMYL